MIILSNDHISQVPKSTKRAQGGTARFGEWLSRLLVSHGHTWHGVISQFRSDCTTPTYEVLSRSRRRVYWQNSIPAKKYAEVTHAVSSKNASRVLQVEIASLCDLIQEIKPDIIFLNGFSLFSWILMRAGNACSIPIVMQHAGIMRKEVEIYKDYFSPAGRRILYQMEREITDHVGAEIFLNAWSAREYMRCVRRVPRSRARIIPLPCDRVVVPKNTQKGTSKKRCHIGIVARWDRIKNHHAVLALAKYAHAQQLPWDFHCVTTIPNTPIQQDFKNEYRANITVEQPKTPSALRRFYRSMDILILPSHFDVSPNVVLEALAEGVGTCISPSVGWQDEYRESGARRWIVDFTKIPQAQERIALLLRDPDVTVLRRAILPRHNPTEVYSAYEKLFKDIAHV